MTENVRFNYQQIEQELLNANSTMHAAEMHGMMAAWLCQHMTNADWQRELFPEICVTDLMDQVFSVTEKQLNENNFAFELLLPAEEVELKERGAALADWCAAFLAGIGIGGLALDTFSFELQEGINDLLEITKLDYADLEDAEENEAAFMELNEFVKAVVMMAYIEMHKKNDAPLH